MVCKVFGLATATVLAFSPSIRLYAQPSAPAPESIFAAMKAATGGVHWDAVAELEQRGDISQGGQQGHCTQYQDLRTGRNAAFCTLGNTPNAQGFDGKRAWFMDEKSMVSVRDSIQAQREAATDAYLARNGWFRANAVDPAQMHYAGRQREAGRTFDVVHVVPKDGMPLDAWVDTRSHLLDRVIENTDDGGTQTTWYSDYRPVDSVLVANVERQGNGDAQYDSTLHVQQTLLHATADDAHFAMPASSVHDAHIEGGASSATVPFTPYAGLIMLELSIDGGKPLPFILDTGGLNLLTPDAARKLGIVGAGHLAVQGVGEATQSMQTAQVKRYRVGDVVMEDQQFLIIDLPRLLVDRGAKEPIAGIVGYELLRRFATRVDYDRNTLTFTPAAQFHGAPGAKAVPIVFNDRTPQIQARVDGAMGTFKLDTGDAGELTVFEPFAKAHGVQPLGQVVADEGKGAGGKIAMKDAYVESFSIGPFTIAHPFTSFAAPAKGAFASTLLAGNIGHGILSRFVPTFDYEHRQLYLEPGARFAQAQPRGRTGVGLDREEHDAFVVAALQPGSAGDQAGVKVGDRVIAIDDVPAAQMGLDDMRRVTELAAGTRVRMTIVRDGVTQVCTLVLRDH